MKISLPWSLLIFTLILCACASGGEKSAADRIVLAEFNESFVDVSIVLQKREDGTSLLQATFTPTEPDAHLYSMELPKEGIEGLGRPTLIELADGSRLQAVGALQESVASYPDSVSPDIPALPVYPAGPVTLQLPVLLPLESKGQIIEQILVTYMTCTPQGCHKPVIEKLVELSIPID